MWEFRPLSIFLSQDRGEVCELDTSSSHVQGPIIQEERFQVLGKGFGGEDWYPSEMCDFGLQYLEECGDLWCEGDFIFDIWKEGSRHNWVCFLHTSSWVSDSLKVKSSLLVSSKERVWRTLKTSLSSFTACLWTYLGISFSRRSWTLITSLSLPRLKER